LIATKGEDLQNAPHKRNAPNDFRALFQIRFQDSESGGGSFGSADDLGLGAEPIFNFVAVFATSLLIELVGAATDSFRDCLCCGLT